MTISDDIKRVIGKFINKRPVPISSICKHLGIKVFSSNLPPNVSGLIKKEGDGYIIKINRNESYKRQRFTAAHELAHYILHKNFIDERGEIKDSVLYRSSISGKKEVEANRLAAQILMPRREFLREYRKYKEIGLFEEDIIKILSEDWGVSEAAVEIRLKQLGVLQ